MSNLHTDGITCIVVYEENEETHTKILATGSMDKTI